MANKTRAEVIVALAAHYSEKLNGKVWADYDDDKRQYTIRGERLPAAPQLAHLYPNGWSLLSYVTPSEAQRLAGATPPAPKNPAPNFRVQFVYDDDARFEECNGEARPLTEAEYAENQYRGCPVHPRSKVPAVNVRNGEAQCGECGQPYADLPYTEYLAYFGNPARHVYIGTIVEKQCGCCQHWEVAESLWGSDFMDDDPALAVVDVNAPDDRGPRVSYTPSEALALPGYFAELARDLLDEAGYKFPRAVYCARKGCKFFHVPDSKYCAQHTPGKR